MSTWKNKKKNVLIGNGINIAFSKNDDYKNYKIIERLTKYLNTNRYDRVFQESITAQELQNVLTELNNSFKKKFQGIAGLRLTQDEDEFNTFVNIARRYQGKPQGLLDIGIEDYFFVMKLIFNEFGDSRTPLEALYGGLRWLFLDAIYNDGEIEKIYQGMSAYSKELKQYDKIFTVNYDTNIDKLTDREVYHLHGSFNVLDSIYRPETMLGYIAQSRPNPPTVTAGMEHLYCNAIMGFSGKQKSDRIELYSKCALLSGASIKDIKYPTDQLETATGELHIIGISPNNDSHIFKLINENPSISRVIYFSASDDDCSAAQIAIKKPLQIRNVFKYWDTIKI